MHPSVGLQRVPRTRNYGLHPRRCASDGGNSWAWLQRRPVPPAQQELQSLQHCTSHSESCSWVGVLSTLRTGCLFNFFGGEFECMGSFGGWHSLHHIFYIHGHLVKNRWNSIKSHMADYYIIMILFTGDVSMLTSFVCISVPEDCSTFPTQWNMNSFKPDLLVFR